MEAWWDVDKLKVIAVIEETGYGKNLREKQVEREEIFKTEKSSKRH